MGIGAWLWVRSSSRLGLVWDLSWWGLRWSPLALPGCKGNIIVLRNVVVLSWPKVKRRFQDNLGLERETRKETPLLGKGKAKVCSRLATITPPAPFVVLTPLRGPHHLWGSPGPGRPVETSGYLVWVGSISPWDTWFSGGSCCSPGREAPRGTCLSFLPLPWAPLLRALFLMMKSSEVELIFFSL